jgi:hypothetical protein
MPQFPIDILLERIRVINTITNNVKQKNASNQDNFNKMMIKLLDVHSNLTILNQDYEGFFDFKIEIIDLKDH